MHCHLPAKTSSDGRELFSPFATSLHHFRGVNEGNQLRSPAAAAPYLIRASGIAFSGLPAGRAFTEGRAGAAGRRRPGNEVEPGDVPTLLEPFRRGALELAG
jgi:hypothetical protein